MKKSILTLAAAIAATATVLSQAPPQAFNYQGIARDNVGNEMPYQKISIKVSILADSLTGTAVYVETHIDTTNEFGLFTLEIGKGTPSSGSFTSILWGGNSHYLKVEMDAAGGTSYLPMGTSQLLSVPYSLYADSAGAAPGSSAQTLSLNGDTLAISSGNSVVLTDNVIDADADPANELQTLTKTGNTISLSNGGGSVSDDVTDADADSTNELQTLSISGNDLTISSGNSVTLPATAPSDTSLYSYSAGYADTADFAYNAGYADTADFAYNTGTATYADTAWFAFAAADDDWTIDADTLYSAADSTVTIKGGKVGIGTVSPGFKMHLRGNNFNEGINVEQTNSNGSSILYLATTGGPTDRLEVVKHGSTVGGNQAGVSLNNLSKVVSLAGPLMLGTAANNHIHMITSNVERMRIDSAGNVGIGTFSPLSILDISKNTGPVITLTKPDPGIFDGNPFGGIQWYSTDLSLTGSQVVASITTVADGDFTATHPGGKILFSTASGSSIPNTTHMVIDKSGNVGIGTISPLMKLDVRGTNAKSTTAAFENIFQAASTDPASPLKLQLGIKTDATATNRYGAIEVDDAGTKRDLVLQPTNGRFLVGTTTPAATFHFRGNTTSGFDGDLLVEGVVSTGVVDMHLKNSGGSNLWFYKLGPTYPTSGRAIAGCGLIEDEGTAGLGIATTSGDLRFYTGANGTPERLIIKNAGNIGIGTVSPVARLDVTDTTAGVLIPRMTQAQRNINVLADEGEMIYQTDNNPGYYYWNGSTWLRLLNGGFPGTAWMLNGNAGTVDSINFIGTTDATPFNIRMNNQKAGRIENGSFFGNNSANTFFGYQAGNANTTGGYNTASGTSALFSNNTGEANTASGVSALSSNTTGNYNTAGGAWALYTNVAGSNATAIGYNAMLYANNTTTPFTNYNVAVGYEALRGSTTASANTGNNNTALGYQTLFKNTTGSQNTANGPYALFNNTTGAGNTALGYETLLNNTTGDGNTASGANALFYNVAGSNATAIGYNAMLYANNQAGAFTNFNVALGFEALRGSTTASANTGNGNTALGYQTLFNNTTGGNSTASGLNALYSNTIGNDNTASGQGALYSNTTGSNNTNSGSRALYWNSTGGSNTALGQNAGYGASGVNFNQCTFLGANSYPTVARTNVTMLGYGIANAQSTGDNQVLLGNTAIASIRAQVTSITAYSDARFKFNIKDDVKGLDFIMKLSPVTYNEDPTILHRIWGTPDSLVRKIDHSEIQKHRFIGFLAQDVEKAAKESGFNFPGIDVPGNDKEVYTLRYVDFIMPMVKGMQEQQKQIEELKAENEVLKTKIETMESLREIPRFARDDGALLQREVKRLQKEMDEVKALLGTKARNE